MGLRRRARVRSLRPKLQLVSPRVFKAIGSRADTKRECFSVSGEREILCACLRTPYLGDTCDYVPDLRGPGHASR